MSTLVQLEDWEVPTDVLFAAGSALVDHPDVAAALAATPALAGEVARLPRMGWVEVYRSRGESGSAYVVLAAPHPDVDDAYLMLRMGSRPDGQRVLAASDSPARAAPSREQRRGELVLAVLGDSIAFTAGSDARVSAELTNVSTQPWVPYRSDAVRLVAYLYQPGGEQPLPARNGFAHGLNNLVERVDPGVRVELAAQWATNNVAGLPPGRYDVRLSMQTLMLSSQPMALTIYPS